MRRPTSRSTLAARGTPRRTGRSILTSWPHQAEPSPSRALCAASVFRAGAGAVFMLGDVWVHDGAGGVSCQVSPSRMVTGRDRAPVVVGDCPGTAWCGAGTLTGPSWLSQHCPRLLEELPHHRHLGVGLHLRA